MWTYSLHRESSFLGIYMAKAEKIGSHAVIGKEILCKGNHMEWFYDWGNQAIMEPHIVLVKMSINRGD